VKLDKLGVSATFECKLSKEGLKVEWSKDSKKIRADEDYDIEVDGQVHRLVVKKAVDKHVGSYKAEHLHLSTAAKLIIQGCGNIFIHGLLSSEINQRGF